MKDYKTCQAIMRAIGHIPVNIMCNKGVGTWFDDETNTVWFDRGSDRVRQPAETRGPAAARDGLPIRKRYEFHVTEAQAGKLLKAGATP